MSDLLITVRRRGVEFVATAPGLAHEGTSHTSARCASIHLFERAHGPQWFTRHRIEQESATFRITAVPPRTFGGRRG